MALGFPSKSVPELSSGCSSKTFSLRSAPPRSASPRPAPPRTASPRADKKREHYSTCGSEYKKEVVTAAHNACIRELLREVSVHGKADRHMRLLKIETESRLGTLWDQEGCSQFCSKEEL